jgi:hypothetical protein
MSPYDRQISLAFRSASAPFKKERIWLPLNSEFRIKPSPIVPLWLEVLDMPFTLLSEICQAQYTGHAFPLGHIIADDGGFLPPKGYDNAARSVSEQAGEQIYESSSAPAHLKTFGLIHFFRICHLLVPKLAAGVQLDTRPFPFYQQLYLCGQVPPFCS